ncbi:MAG TPA: hypothetical protein PK696_02960 [bacterium]|jgi:hypothetical protein|nr:hypothetical protein [Chlamydiota bacterium]HOE26639.1 hypothetical protein [bacterium]HQM53632.1 hypothetical protein [bacterium]
MQMKPDLVYSVLCDDVRQEINGKFIFLGVFQNIWVKGLPAVHHRLCIANSWYNGIGEFHARSAVVAPDKKTRVVESVPVKIVLTEENRGSIVVNFFQNIRFAEEGLYWVEVSLEGTLVTRYPFRVARAPQRPPAGP